MGAEDERWNGEMENRKSKGGFEGHFWGERIGIGLGDWKCA